MFHCVYSLVPPQARPALALEQAAVLSVGLNGFLSHHSAAAAWGFLRSTDGPIELILAGRQVRPRPGVKLHEVKTLGPRDTQVLSGIPITSPARTFLDIAADLELRALERGLDEAIVRHLVTRHAVLRMVQANSGRPGCGRLRALADPARQTSMTRSEAEERFLMLVRRAGLPVPAANARLGRYEVDFLWRRERLVVEIDGFAFHSSRAALERDHRRDAELQAAGYMVIRTSWRELTHEPARVLAQLAAALALRGPSSNRNPK